MSERLIAKFNEAYPVGSEVMWRSVNIDGFPFKPHTVAHEAYDHYGMPVCFLKERSGFVSIEHGFVDYTYRSNPNE